MPPLKRVTPPAPIAEYADTSQPIRLLEGDCRETLRRIRPGSVDCCVTSPPYWRLRSYLPKDHPLKHLEIGSEATLAEYVQTIVGVMRLVRTCLADHGTVWLNVGDTYSFAGGGKVGTKQQTNVGSDIELRQAEGLGQGNLCLIPYRLAIALQEPWEADICVRSEVDRAWLAAIFDGEGCIGIRHCASAANAARGWNANFSPYTAVGMNDKEVLDHCVSISRIGTVRVKEKAGTDDSRGIHSRRDQYTWRLDGPPSIDIVRAIYPYLIAKKKQAILAHTLDCLNKTRSARNAPVPPDVQEKKARLWELIKQCNQREPVDLPDWAILPKKKLELGWLVRSIVVWHKPAAMPISVRGWRWERCRVKVGSNGITKQYTNQGAVDVGLAGGEANAVWQDCPGCPKCQPHGGYVLRKSSWRPTSSWEPILLLAKQNGYYCDGEAVKQPSSSATVERNQYSRIIDDPDEQFAVAHDHEFISDGANLRDVWTIGPEPLKEKHYAAFPTKLVDRCLKAGTSQKGYCSACGKPWARVVNYAPSLARQGRGYTADCTNRNDGDRPGSYLDGRFDTTGWRPSCSCNTDPRPALVLDPFCGSGRTASAAQWLGLRFVGCELNPEYVKIAERQIKGSEFNRKKIWGR